MWKYIILLAAVSICTSNAWSEQYAETKDCEYCDHSKCAKNPKCPAGVVRDRCGCCDVCGLEEGQLCNYSPGSNETHVWNGYCGASMECEKRDDMSSSSIEVQSVCVCLKKGSVCASDKKTYSICQFYAEKNKARELGKDLKIEHQEPCLTKPKITSISKSTNVFEGSKHSIVCEVEAYPVAKIEWLFKSSQNGKKSIRMPASDTYISTSERGGPEESKITGYLQITNFQRKHEGQYTCNAVSQIDEAHKDVTLVFSKKSTKNDL